MFHRISPDIDELWPSLKPHQFEKFIQLLTYNFDIISLDEIKTQCFLNKNLFIITFDDGYKDFLNNAIPILNKYKIKVNLNICPNLINTNSLPWTQKLNVLLSKKNNTIIEIIKDFNIDIRNNNNLGEEIFNNICNKIHSLDNSKYNSFIERLNSIEFKFEKILLNWDELLECKKSNVVIGNHSFNHLNLNKLNEKSLDSEIFDSKLEIEKRLNLKVNIFSIPNGMINIQALNKLKKLYKIILFSDYNRSLLTINNDIILLNRINISLNNPYEEFFRAIGFHHALKKFFLFFFKKNNKT